MSWNSKKSAAQTPSYAEIVAKNYGEYTKAQQKTLQNSKVLVVGVGGDGGWVAHFLGRIGVGNITIVDNDTVEPSNINRQCFATVPGIGKKKVGIGRQMINDINPNIKVKAYDLHVSEKNAHKIIQGHDIVVQCFDDWLSRIIIHRTARKMKIPVVSQTGRPPFRLWITSFFPESPDFEKVMNMPTRNLSIDELKKKQRFAKTMGSKTCCYVWRV